MGKIYKNGILFAGGTDNAKSVAFDNTDTDLKANNVQDAIKEVKNDVTEINSNLEWNLLEEFIGTNSSDVRNIDLTKYKEILITFRYTPTSSETTNEIRNFTINIPVICLTADFLNYSTGCFQNETTNNAFFAVKVSSNQIAFPAYSAYYLTKNVGSLTVAKVYAR